MTHFIEQINAILADLRESGEIPASNWPGDAPISAIEMGLEERSKKIILPAQSDLIDLEYIEHELPCVKTRRFEAIGSTNTEMLKVADNEPIDDLLYLAEYQYSGRGRHGRSWISPYARNLSISYGLETNLPFASMGCLSLVIGLAVSDTLKSIGLDMVKLKWPNDILVDGKKLAGILVELSNKERSRAVVIGLGLNIDISRDEQVMIDQPLTDCRSLGVKFSRSDLIIILVRSMRLYIAQYLEKGFKPLKEQYEELMVYREKFCRLQVGEKIVAEGILKGVNERGELEFCDKGSLRTYRIGEISLRPVDSSPLP